MISKSRNLAFLLHLASIHCVRAACGLLDEGEQSILLSTVPAYKKKKRKNSLSFPLPGTRYSTTVVVS